MRSKVRRPVLAIIGAGRVGCGLGRRLHQKGWRIGPVVTHSMRTARAATRRIGAGKPQAGISDALLTADVILIATPDRAIGKAAESLGRLGGAESKAWRGKIVLHTSGALGSDILEPLALLRAATGSLHPLQTFGSRNVPSLAGCTCAIEGSATALRMAQRICRELEAVPVVLPQRQKAAYHAAAALAAGHVLAVIEAAARVLMSAGFTRPRATRALLLLTRQTLANYEHAGARAAWTGPLNRGDFGVIERHLEALRRFPREYREAYDALSRLGVKVLAKSSILKKRQLERTLKRIN